MFIHQCFRCRKKGFFLRLNDELLCDQCVEEEIVEAERFIRGLSARISRALEHTVILPQWGKKRIQEQRSHCDYVLEHIDDWKNVRRFKEAFERTLQQRGSVKVSPLFPNVPINTGFLCTDFDSLFADLKKDISNVLSACLMAEFNAYDYSRIFTVVGVTFKNGRKSRQTILRKLRYGDPPFGYGATIELEKYDFEGEDAIGVYADGEQVGNISRKDLPWLLDHWEDYFSVSEYDIHGGGGLSYGMDIRVCFRTQSE